MVDELLAKMEPKTSGLEPRGAGIPELTAQDVAAALAICQDRFAAEMYQAIYGGHLHWREVDRLLAEFQFAEWRRRMERMVDAQLAIATAEATIEGRTSARVWAEQMLAGAQAAMWPPLVEERYAGIRRGVVAELRSKERNCTACAGRGTVMAGKLLQNCRRCVGTGRTPVSIIQRARACGINDTTFDRTWRPVYEWMYFRLIDICKVGRWQFEEALGRVR